MGKNTNTVTSSDTDRDPPQWSSTGARRRYDSRCIRKAVYEAFDRPLGELCEPVIAENIWEGYAQTQARGRRDIDAIGVGKGS